MKRRTVMSNISVNVITFQTVASVREMLENDKYKITLAYLCSLSRRIALHVDANEIKSRRWLSTTNISWINESM